MKKNRRLFLAIVVLVIAVIYLLQNIHLQPAASESFRDFTHLVFTKHAKCRMDCRNINEKEIKEIIEKGQLNKSKSGFDKKHQNETYALEGYSYEKQHIRVVVTPQNDGLLVITVIDLDKDWACDCD